MKFVSDRSGQEPKTKYFLRSFCGQSADTQYNTTELPCHTTALRPTQLGTFAHMNHTTTFELTVYLKSLCSPLHRRTIGRLHTFARLSSRCTQEPRK